MNNKEKLLIFDFDGVIADTYHIYLDFLIKKLGFRKNYAIKKLTKSSTELVSKPSNLFQKIGEKWYYHNFFKYVEKQGQSLLFPEIIEQIQNLKQPKAILTRAEKRVCLTVLQEHSDLFEIIIGRNEAKNKASGLDLILNQKNLQNYYPIFITDTIADVLEMQRVLKSDQIYGVSWGFNETELLEKYLEKDKILHQVKDLEIFRD